MNPVQPVGQKLEPLFSPTLLDYTRASGICAGTDGSRVYFSIAQQGAGHNSTVLEFYPLFGSFTQRADAMACYVNYRTGGSVLLGASPTVTGQLYQLNSGGSYDGAPITSRFLTRVLEPLGGFESRVQQIKVKGRSPGLNVQLLPDFAPTGSQAVLRMGQGTGFKWDVGKWGIDPWGAGDFPESFDETWPRTHCRTCQVRIDETSTLTSSVNVEGVSVTVGGWAVYGITLKNAWIGMT